MSFLVVRDTKYQDRSTWSKFCLFLRLWDE